METVDEPAATVGDNAASSLPLRLDRTSQFRRIASEMREYSNQIDLRDYDNILRRSDYIRSAMSIKDVVETKKMPFRVDGVPSAGYRSLLDSESSLVQSPSVQSLDSQSMIMASDDSLPMLLPISEKAKPSNSRKQSTGFSAGKPVGAAKTGKRQANAFEMKKLAETKYQQELQEEKLRKALDSKLQHVVKLIERAKHDVNASKLNFESADVFYKMEAFDRAMVLYEKATISSDATAIVDTEQMPNDIHFQRKIERMSPSVLPTFLAQRQAERDRRIFAESEVQRLRKRDAHCQLTRIYLGLSEMISGQLAAAFAAKSVTTAAASNGPAGGKSRQNTSGAGGHKAQIAQLAISLRDLWKAQHNLQQAFVCCVNHEEHNAMLVYFHKLIVTFFHQSKGQSEFSRDQQILRSSAGPIAEAHITILHELEQLLPNDADVLYWLAVRYSEKCMFDESQHYFKKQRDISRVQPGIKETLELWRLPAEADTLEERQLKADIQDNVYKNTRSMYTQSQSQPQHALKMISQRDHSDEVRQSHLASQQRDLSTFAGVHEDSTTIIYAPPRRGWVTDEAT